MWDAATGEKLHTYFALNIVNSVEFSPIDDRDTWVITLGRGHHHILIH